VYERPGSVDRGLNMDAIDFGGEEMVATKVLPTGEQKVAARSSATREQSANYSVTHVVPLVNTCIQMTLYC
jgi:hypothetical protein